MSIKDTNGLEHISEESISRVAIQYLEDLFKSSGNVNWGDFFDGCQSFITQEMNDSLTADVSNEEVVKAIKSIGGDRAPGPDGLLVPSTINSFHQFARTSSLKSKNSSTPE